MRRLLAVRAVGHGATLSACATLRTAQATRGGAPCPPHDALPLPLLRHTRRRHARVCAMTGCATRHCSSRPGSDIVAPRGAATSTKTEAPATRAERSAKKADEARTGGESRNAAMIAFDRFAKRVDGCTAAEFLVGARQAYYSLGAFLGKLFDHVEGGKTSDKRPHSESAEIAAMEQMLGKEFAPERYWDKTVLTPWQADPALPRDVRLRTLLAAIMSIVPSSLHLARTILDTWRLQDDAKGNLYHIAAPTDYVLNARLALFASIQDTKSGVADSIVVDTESMLLDPGAARAFDAVRRQGGDGADAAEDAATSNVDSSAGSSPVGEQLHPSRPRVTLSHSVPIAVPSCATSAETMTSGAAAAKTVQTADHKGKGDEAGVTRSMRLIHVEVNKMAMLPIPDTALAFAIVRMDIVVPPGRYAPHYEWFYNRIDGYQSEYERIAAARLFALYSPHAFVSAIDFIARMLVGVRPRFVLSGFASRLCGIPANVDRCPPAVRKFVCLYMDTAKQWTLADVAVVSPVLSTELPAM